MNDLKKVRAANVMYIVATQCKGNRSEFDRRIDGRNTAYRIINGDIENPTRATKTTIEKEFALPEGWLDTNHGYTMDPASYYSKGGDADMTVDSDYITAINELTRSLSKAMDHKDDMRALRQEIEKLKVQCEKFELALDAVKGAAPVNKGRSLKKAN